MSIPSDDLFAMRFFIGKNQQPMFGILDTATEFVALEGHECQPCTQEVYDIRTSMDAGEAGIGAATETIPYGGHAIRGKWGFDKFCIGLNQCIEQMDFFYMSTSHYERPVQAVIGMARPNVNMILNPILTPLGKKYLLSDLPVTRPTFSTRLQRRYISWIDFGKPDSKQHEEEQVKINMIDDFFWSAWGQGIRIGEDNKDAYRFEKDP